MGTSGAYGGSNRQEWKRARELLEHLPGEIVDSRGGEETAHDLDQLDEGPLADLWGAIADALNTEDPLIDSEQPVEELFSFPELLPRPRFPRTLASEAAGRGGQARSLRGASGAAGRKGSRSSRSVLRGAARGGAAIGGAYAIRRGDATALHELGLDLEELRRLSPRMQCARILDAVLGEGGHPDEYALREAAAEQLKAILLSENPPSEVDTLRGFIAAFVFRLALVELRRELTSGRLSAAQAAWKESRIRRWAERRVRMIRFSVERRLPIRQFRIVAAKLAREALRLLRAGTSD